MDGEILNEESRNDSVTVGTSSTLVSVAQRRTEFCLRNISSSGQTITVHLGEGDAVANKGIVLRVNEILVCDSTDSPCWQGKISAIASAASATLSVYMR